MRLKSNAYSVRLTCTRALYVLNVHINVDKHLSSHLFQFVTQVCACFAVDMHVDSVRLKYLHSLRTRDVHKHFVCLTDVQSTHCALHVHVRILRAYRARALGAFAVCCTSGAHVTCLVCSTYFDRVVLTRRLSALGIHARTVCA